jgi:hypothetical protein
LRFSTTSVLLQANEARWFSRHSGECFYVICLSSCTIPGGRTLRRCTPKAGSALLKREGKSGRSLRESPGRERDASLLASASHGLASNADAAAATPKAAATATPRGTVASTAAGTTAAVAPTQRGSNSSVASSSTSCEPRVTGKGKKGRSYTDNGSLV